MIFRCLWSEFSFRQAMCGEETNVSRGHFPKALLYSTRLVTSSSKKGIHCHVHLENSWDMGKEMKGVVVLWLRKSSHAFSTLNVLLNPRRAKGKHLAVILGQFTLYFRKSKNRSKTARHDEVERIYIPESKSLGYIATWCWVTIPPPTYNLQQLLKSCICLYLFKRNKHQAFLFSNSSLLSYSEFSFSKVFISVYIDINFLVMTTSIVFHLA